MSRLKKFIISQKNTHTHTIGPVVTPISLILMGFIHNWVIMRFHSSIDWCVVGFIYNWVVLKFHSFIHPSIVVLLVSSTIELCWDFIHPLLCCWFHSQSSCIEISSIHPSIHPSVCCLTVRLVGPNPWWYLLHRKYADLGWYQVCKGKEHKVHTIT
jgi:hypothetical protein